MAAVIVQHDEFHALVAALVPFTRFMLQTCGGFLPLGGSVTSGEVNIAEPDADAPHDGAQAWLARLQEELRLQAADLRCTAVAYCVDVKLTDARNGEVLDAMQVVFEHRCGEALDAFFPYRKNNDGYEFGQPMLRIGAPRLFENTSSSYVN